MSLFTPYTVPGSHFVLRNRTMRSATWEGMANEKGEVRF